MRQTDNLPTNLEYLPACLPACLPFYLAAYLPRQDADGLALAEWLKHSPTLRKLWLEHNELRMRGACALLDAAITGGELQELTLEGNGITPHECTALERLARGGTLQLRTRPEERFEDDFEEEGGAEAAQAEAGEDAAQAAQAGEEAEAVQATAEGVEAEAEPAAAEEAAEAAATLPTPAALPVSGVATAAPDPAPTGAEPSNPRDQGDAPGA